MAKIKVKQSKDVDYSVNVRKEAEPEINIDYVVSVLRELDNWEYKQVLKIAKQYRKADAMISRISE